MLRLLQFTGFTPSIDNPGGLQFSRQATGGVAFMGVHRCGHAHGLDVWTVLWCAIREARLEDYGVPDTASSELLAMVLADRA